MEKIKTVAVIIANNIQFDSFKNAIDIMLKQNINVDIFIPQNYDNDGFNTMFDEIYNKLTKMKYIIYRETNEKKYDILFMPYMFWQFNDLKRKYTIRYLYGLTTKPEFFFSLETNYIFDGFLCYGNYDAESLKNFGLTFKIGNIKYLNYKNKQMKKNGKKTILYLPTYGKYSSIETIRPMLELLKEKFNIIIKPHHGTEYEIDELEQKRMKYIKNNFKNIFSSTYSLLDLLNNCDIIITDQSGAVFDAVCAKKPVLMYYSDTENNNFSLPVKYAKKGYITSFTKLENENQLEKLINQTMDPKQMNKQNKLFNILFCPQKDIENNFLQFLKDIENGIFNNDYYEIHQLQKKQLTSLYENNNKVLNLTTDLENCQKKILSLTNEIEESKQNYKEIKTKFNNIKEQYNNVSNEYSYFKQQIYNSKSWKLTKPLRYFNQLIKKVKK